MTLRCYLQVTAEALAATVQELQGKLASQGTTMKERQQKLADLQQRLAEESATLEASTLQVCRALCRLDAPCISA